MSEDEKENAAIGSAIREGLLFAATTGDDPHMAIAITAFAAARRLERKRIADWFDERASQYVVDYGSESTQSYDSEIGDIVRNLEE